MNLNPAGLSRFDVSSSWEEVTLAAQLHLTRKRSGVPVLMMKGNNLLSRLGESIALNSGCERLVAKDLHTYVAKAVSFARFPETLTRFYRESAASSRKTSVFDIKKYIECFEAMLISMWKNRENDAAEIRKRCF